VAKKSQIIKYCNYFLQIIPEHALNKKLYTHLCSLYFLITKSSVWYFGIAVSVVELDFALAGEKSVENVGIAVLSPPLAQLSVPRARKFENQARLLQPQQGEEVLVAQVALKLVLFGQGSHRRSWYQRFVLGGEPHSIQVQQHHAAVETREAVFDVWLSNLIKTMYFLYKYLQNTQAGKDIFAFLDFY
jgi:hypothetical protein